MAWHLVHVAMCSLYVVIAVAVVGTFDEIKKRLINTKSREKYAPNEQIHSIFVLLMCIEPNHS